jgi:hypothetical protein
VVFFVFKSAANIVKNCKYIDKAMGFIDKLIHVADHQQVIIFTGLIIDRILFFAFFDLLKGSL